MALDQGWPRCGLRLSLPCLKGGMLHNFPRFSRPRWFFDAIAGQEELGRKGSGVSRSDSHTCRCCSPGGLMCTRGMSAARGGLSHGAMPRSSFDKSSEESAGVAGSPGPTRMPRSPLWRSRPASLLLCRQLVACWLALGQLIPVGMCNLSAAVSYVATSYCLFSLFTNLAQAAW